MVSGNFFAVAPLASIYLAVQVVVNAEVIKLKNGVVPSTVPSKKWLTMEHYGAPWLSRQASA